MVVERIRNGNFLWHLLKVVYNDKHCNGLTLIKNPNYRTAPVTQMQNSHNSTVLNNIINLTCLLLSFCQHSAYPNGPLCAEVRMDK